MLQVMTSFHPEDMDDYLLVIASTTQPQNYNLPSKLRIKLPRSKAYFTGTGNDTLCSVRDDICYFEVDLLQSAESTVSCPRLLHRPHILFFDDLQGIW